MVTVNTVGDGGGPARKPLRVAVVGCGAIAESFYVPALARRQATTQFVLVDVNLARARELARHLETVEVADDYKKVVGSVDAAIVAVPHHLHVPIARAFLDSRAHVLCEKPIAEDPSDVTALVQLARERGVTLGVNNTRRLMPSSLETKRLLEQGQIGTIRSITYLDGNEFAWPTASGFYFDSSLSSKGVLFDLGAHVLDLICWWLGGKPTVVSSVNDSFGGSESVAALTLEKGECRCTVRISRLGRLANTYTIVGDKGEISGQVYDGSRLTTKKSGPSGSLVTTLRMEKALMSDIADRLIGNLYDILGNGGVPLVPASEVGDSIQLLQEAYQQATRFSMPWYEIGRVGNE